jgi:hypothetical protein
MNFVIARSVLVSAMVMATLGNFAAQASDGGLGSYTIPMVEAETIATDYALQFKDTLLVAPKLLRASGFLVSSQPPSYRMSVENPAVNNTYWCDFAVTIDAQTGAVIEGNSANKWRCEFLADFGGGT